MESPEDTGDNRCNGGARCSARTALPRGCTTSRTKSSKRPEFAGLIVDLDNTLLGFRETELAREHLDWVARAHDRGFRIVMLSNNFSERVTTVAAQLERRLHPQRAQAAAVRISAREACSGAAPARDRRGRRSALYRRAGREALRLVHDSHRADRVQGFGAHARLPVLRALDAAEPAHAMKLALIGDPVEHSAQPAAAPRRFSTRPASTAATLRFGSRAERPSRRSGGCSRRIYRLQRYVSAQRRSASRRATAQPTKRGAPRPSTRFFSARDRSARTPTASARAARSRR